MTEELKKILSGKSVFIATPCYGGMCSEQYMRSVSMLSLALNKLSVPFNISTVVNESLVMRARNKLVRSFLDTDCTHLFFIDADIEFNYNDAIRMLSSDKDVVVGSYPLKTVRLDRLVDKKYESLDDIQSVISDYVINIKPSENNIYKVVDGLIEIYDAGTGFMMIKREVIEKMIDNYPETSYRGEGDDFITHALFDTMIDEDGRYLSEDYTFCRRWQKIGGKVWLDPHVVLNHIGSYVYRGKKIFTFGDE